MVLVETCMKMLQDTSGQRGLLGQVAALRVFSGGTETPYMRILLEVEAHRQADRSESSQYSSVSQSR
jgi:hypothetical protein